MTAKKNFLLLLVMKSMCLLNHVILLQFCFSKAKFLYVLLVECMVRVRVRVCPLTTPSIGHILPPTKVDTAIVP